MKLLIGSTNYGKIEKWRTLLPDFEIVTPQDLDIQLDIKEGMNSLEENAKNKALSYAKASGLVTLSEDVGFFIKELNNKPGIAVRRWAGELSKETSDDEFMQFFREQIKSLKTGEADFKIMIAVANPQGQVQVHSHKYQGYIDKDANKKWVAGFPISSMFVRKDGISWNETNDITKRELMKEVVQDVKKMISTVSSRQDVFEKIYQKPNAVWTRHNPPRELVQLLESNKIKPCKMLDIACGEGLYDIYLAKQGFDVTGIDFSKKAIEYATKNAKDHHVNINFKVLDVKDLTLLQEQFEFVFEWGLLHHLPIEQWEDYFKNVVSIMKPKARFFGMSFDINSPEFEGPGIKKRLSPRGTKLYYESKENVEEMLSKYFTIIESKTSTLEKAQGPAHLINTFLVEKN